MYSTRKLAEKYGLSESLVRSMAREGILPGEQEGGRWHMEEDAAEILDELVEPAEDDHEDEDDGGSWDEDDHEDDVDDEDDED